MNRPRSAHQGFTLVEIIVAMAVGGIVVLGARQLVESLTRSTRAITEYTAVTAHEGNAERVVRELVQRVEVGLELPPFGGTATSVSFSTWCDVAGGWAERCIATLATGAESTAWQYVSSPADVKAVIVSLGGVHRLLYFDGSSERRVWKAVWMPGGPLPLALGLVRQSDTLILRIGYRG